MKYRRMPIEVESPEESGYKNLCCNLAESSVTDAKWKELGIQLDDLTLAYGDHKGDPKLREFIAAMYQGITADDVLITAGAAPALFIVATSLLEKEDHLVVQFPNYATNLETPFAIGCGISKIEMKFENDFIISVADIEKQVKSNTRLISITNPHNPTGTTISHDALNELISLAEKKNCFLLVDETYRDLMSGEKLPLAATLSENAISVSSVSKAHGLPGIRIGWLITRNKKLQETFLAAKEQIFICNSGVDEAIAYRYLQTSEARRKWAQQHVTKSFSIVENWMKQNEFLEWVKPSGGCVCFPRFKSDIRINIELFYKTLNEKYGTFVGPGHWFGMEDRYMRIGFGWPSQKELEEGLQNILFAAKEASR